MKIITDNNIYVQKNDIAYLNQCDLNIPASIFIKVFSNSMVIIDDRNRYEFVRFDEPREIDFFKSLDWIIDYNEVKDLTKEEIISLAQNVLKQKKEIAQKYNSMSKEKRKENQGMVLECHLLDFKLYSLRDLLLFKEGKLKMNIPNSLEYLKNSKKEPCLKRILKKIKKSESK